MSILVDNDLIKNEKSYTTQNSRELLNLNHVATDFINNSGYNIFYNQNFNQCKDLDGKTLYLFFIKKYN